jgi:polyamine oxidase
MLSVFIENEAQKQPRVLILGGGLAGLRVGQVLQSHGLQDFLILEADNKLGGRFLAVCVPGADACINELYMESKLPAPHPLTELIEECGIAYGREELGPTKAVTDEGQDVSEEVDTTIQHMDEVFASLITQWNTSEEDMSLDGAFRLHGWNPRTPVELAVDSMYSDLFYGNKPSEVSTHRFVSEWDAVFTSDPFTVDIYSIRDDHFGNQRLVNCLKNSFLKANDERVKLDTKVSDIAYSDSGVTVTTSDGVTYEADYAVVTFGLGVLQQKDVTFRPRLSYAKRKAINQFRVGYYTIVYSQFDSNKIDGSTDLNSTVFYYYVSRQRNEYLFFYELFSSIENKEDHTKSYNLFSHWLSGEDALRVETQSINRTKAELTEIYRKFFGANISEPDVFVTQVNTNPFYYGATAVFPAGVSIEDFDRLREPHGRVFFAGEAYRMTTSIGGATRALYSGNETAMAVLDCIVGRSCSMAPYAKPKRCPEGVFLSSKSIH